MQTIWKLYIKYASLRLAMNVEVSPFVLRKFKILKVSLNLEILNRAIKSSYSEMHQRFDALDYHDSYTVAQLSQFCGIV